MYRQLPNALTMLRLLLAALFFFVLNAYRYPHTSHWALLVALVVFVLAVVTDALDGHLARRWKVESTFGRIMDPFCDKVLIIGAFIYLAGARFAEPSAVQAAAQRGDLFTMASGVYPWMVAVILARELLVTSVRGELEGQGVHFGANVWGKLKMILQSVGVPIILIIVWLDPATAGREWLAILRDALVYLIVTVTLVSGLPYVVQAVRVMRKADSQ